MAGVREERRRARESICCMLADEAVLFMVEVGVAVFYLCYVYGTEIRNTVLRIRNAVKYGDSIGRGKSMRSTVIN